MGEKTVATVKYILLTIANRTVRVAIGVQPNHTPIVYWMKKGDGFSYVLYQGCMTEEEGNQILDAAEADNYAAAVRLFHKYFRGENSEKVYAEEEGLVTSWGERLYAGTNTCVGTDP